MTNDLRAPLRPVDDLVAAIVGGLEPVPIESLPLTEAAGRVLAEDVVAPTDLPPWTVAAMDGVAVRAADTANAPVALRLVGTTLAGEAAGPSLTPGTGRDIATGAPLPPGADAVVRLERLTVDDDSVTIPAPVAPGTDVRHAGENARAGERLSSSGQRLTTAVLAGLAGAGIEEVPVRRQPRITILPTGDELALGTVPDAIGPGLTQLLGADGALVTVAAPVPDDADALTRALSTSAVVSDVVLTTGGVSVGPADLSLEALQDVGTGHGESLALRPGRPFAWGRVGATLVVCLPGNPAAALAAAVLIVRPVVAALLGTDPPRPVLLRAASPFPADPQRRQLLPAVRTGADEVALVAGRGSGDLVALAGADTLVDIQPGDNGPRTGEWVTAWSLP